jgi:stage II sporulation protein P
MKKTANRILIFALLLLLLAPVAQADDWFEPNPGYYTLVDEKGEELTVMAREISVDDEYVSGDNKHYIVTKVDKDKKTAYTKLLGEITLPVLEPADPIAVAQQEKGTILLYCTHNSESYVPSDGKESIKGNGGIYDVAESFQKNLEAKGINAVFSKEKHDPHDAGAYRRSRQTAVKLIKENMPVRAVFDIHRDAVPKSHYVTEVDGQDMSKVRIVIGRRNQNRKANEELAYKIKAVADKNYPGLIKDIFMGKGSYNQELSPRSLLFEMGTFENSKEAAQKSTAYLADVVAKAMYGGTVQQHEQKTGESKGEKSKVTPINQEKEKSGGGRGLLWLFVVLAVGAIGFLFISTGSREMFSKVKNSSRQEFSSFLGRKKKK